MARGLGLQIPAKKRRVKNRVVLSRVDPPTSRVCSKRGGHSPAALAPLPRPARVFALGIRVTLYLAALRGRSRSVARPEPPRVRRFAAWRPSPEKSWLPLPLALLQLWEEDPRVMPRVRATRRRLRRLTRTRRSLRRVRSGLNTPRVSSSAWSPARRPTKSGTHPPQPPSPTMPKLEVIGDGGEEGEPRGWGGWRDAGTAQRWCVSGFSRDVDGAGMQ
jgi:hypothetical protein